MTKNQFCREFHLEHQWFTTLVNRGVLSIERKGIRLFIDPSEASKLIEGKTFISCPKCGKKMGVLSKVHTRMCGGEIGCDVPCELHSQNRMRSEEEKQKQSETLKKRFQTPEGQETRKVISEASLRLNSDPAFIERKREKARVIQNTPEMKALHRKQTKEMWADPVHKGKIKAYQEANKEKIAASAAKAKLHRSKTSSGHVRYKEEMVKSGIVGFTSEYQFHYYAIDEADPLARIAVEIDGCYWHGCEECGFEGVPYIRNTDKRKETYLRNRGWLVLRVKEHDLLKNPQHMISMIKELQQKRRQANIHKLRESFTSGELKVRSINPVTKAVAWSPVEEVCRHRTPDKKMYEVQTEVGSSTFTEDHSVFSWDRGDTVRTSDVKPGQALIGIPFNKSEAEPLQVSKVEERPSEPYTYDLSVPGDNNFVLDSGILAHNTYSVGGVSLDIEKSSKYESMKNNFIQEWDKARDLAKQSIKIVVGLSQPRYGVGISSALGPYSRPGVQSRRNFISGFGA